MNEYVAVVAFQESYLPKLIDWVQKQRFKLIEHAMENHITLKIDIFTFELKLRDINDE